VAGGRRRGPGVRDAAARPHDPKMTLGLYAKALRSKRRRAHSRRDAGQTLDWASTGTSGGQDARETQGQIAA
jgi:hypothetical protein